MIVQRQVYVDMTLPLPPTCLHMTIEFEHDKAWQVPVRDLPSLKYQVLISFNDTYPISYVLQK